MTKASLQLLWGRAEWRRAFVSFILVSLLQSSTELLRHLRCHKRWLLIELGTLFLICRNQINCSPEQARGAAQFAPQGKSSMFAQSAFINPWGVEVGLALFSSVSPILHT